MGFWLAEIVYRYSFRSLTPLPLPPSGRGALTPWFLRNTSVKQQLARVQ
ncbi:hypothetical protein JOD20_000430 [Herpetosiphon giganteus]|nr:hypothetical protein [Herpetosiphon giganteus]